MQYAIQSHGARDGKKFTNRDAKTYATREEAQAILDEREVEGSSNPGSEIVEVDYGPYACTQAPDPACPACPACNGSGLATIRVEGGGFDTLPCYCTVAGNETPVAVADPAVCCHCGAVNANVVTGEACRCTACGETFYASAE